MVGKRFWLLLLLALSVSPIAAEEPAGVPEKKEPIEPERVQLGDWMTVDRLLVLREQVVKDIEDFTRMRFRRPVPLLIMPYRTFEAQQANTGMGGWAANHASAYYSPSSNTVTFIPWGRKFPMPEQFWEDNTRATMVHEMTHAIHYHNFFTEGRNHRAGAKIRGLTDAEIDGSVVDSILTEGFAELVEYNVSQLREDREARKARPKREPLTQLRKFRRNPERSPANPLTYMKRYVPDEDAKNPFRMKILSYCYQDGLTLMYHLMLHGGMRAVRSVLYRRPARILLFQPEILATADLDDPPEPDAILGFLHTGPMDDEGILLATNPGSHRFFRGAMRGHARGCLTGYFAKAPAGHPTNGHYSFFVANPEAKNAWIQEQRDSLMKLHTGKKLKPKTVTLPMTARKDKLKATLLTVTTPAETIVYAEISGLIVMAKQITPKRDARNLVKRLEERVLLALRALYVKIPRTGVFDAARKTANAELGYGR
ncbi:MAG: hypothetical protein V3T86_15835 [Planctomycetota bacterium]